MRSEEHRKTKETDIELTLVVDGTGRHDISTPVPFLSHMLESFARHGRFDLTVRATGDIHVDPHHTVEDVGLVLGNAFRNALGTREGLWRFGDCTLPMDETLVTVAVDLSGRPAFEWRVTGLEGRFVGTFDCALAKEFFAAFATRCECNLHVLLHHGGNPHHVIEAVFKALARALDGATRLDPRIAGQVPSTKGSLGG